MTVANNDSNDNSKNNNLRITSDELKKNRQGGGHFCTRHTKSTRT